MTADASSTSEVYLPLTATTSNTTDGLRMLVEQQMRDFLREEGFPDADGWSPRWKVERMKDGSFRAGFIDERSVGWYNQRMGTNLKVIQYRDPGRAKTSPPEQNLGSEEPKLNRAQRRAAAKKLKSTQKKMLRKDSSGNAT